MHKIYTCKYFAIWSKYTNTSKSIFTLHSHANSVHISILKGTNTCCTVDTYRLLKTAVILLMHWSCTWVEKLLGRKNNLMSGGLMLLK